MQFLYKALCDLIFKKDRVHDHLTVEKEEMTGYHKLEPDWSPSSRLPGHFKVFRGWGSSRPSRWPSQTLQRLVATARRISSPDAPRPNQVQWVGGLCQLCDGVPKEFRSADWHVFCRKVRGFLYPEKKLDTKVIKFKKILQVRSTRFLRSRIGSSWTWLSSNRCTNR